MNFPFEAESSLAWIKKRKKVETIVFNIWGSCNGLICLGIRMSPETKEEEDPATREYKKISLPICDGYYSVRYGFGYDNSIDDYQLVSVTDYEYAGSFKIKVYTLGSDSWSTIRTPVPYSVPVDITHGLLFKGALHWLGTTTDQKSSAEVIISFDVSSKRLMGLSFPERSLVRTMNYPIHRRVCKNVAVLGDHLCLAFIECSKVDLWLMQDYGVRESWTKQFTCTRLSLTRRLLCKPIWCLESGEILIQTDQDLVLYDQRNNTTRNVRICGDTMGSNLETYVESIVSLKSGTYVEMPRSRRTMMKDATKSRKTMTRRATRH
ncbi:F-box/kelch-repeat protein At3g06240-like [Papaver somniferum]|uniref:F-box/kelch-repeat protein At3g06240-like n=1 Tax=Papaver somniferum TaxID=3469 RepID=UPI000E6F73AB|nr:F-box/kelch-repeat protein At3g06240-like [Papaver somniferum]